MAGVSIIYKYRFFPKVNIWEFFSPKFEEFFIRMNIPKILYTPVSW